jgi:Tfp pilus assembly protein PilO
MTGALVCAGLSGLFICGVVWPLLGHRSAAEARESAMMAEKSKASQLASQVARVKSDLDSIHEAIASNSVSLESEDRLNNRLASITGFSKKCGVEIEDITPGSPVHGPQFDHVIIHLAARGGYRNCVNFFHQLHDNYPDMAIRTFRIAGEPQSPGGPVAINFDLVWFARPGATASAQ